ncbi:hypothetical protein TWF694_010010 [Orbilia ellipsospora]|uniref:Uncharacterized protein n=1 Tax=Orbilia ellipsospora TaxID=2528407 RepID=A0AAV9X9T9_9PEZI
MTQCFNLQQNITHLEMEIESTLPVSDSADDLKAAEAQRDVSDAVDCFENLIYCMCQSLEQDQAPWPTLKSLSNALQPLKRTLARICEGFKRSSLSYTFTKAQCDRMRAHFTKLSSALKATIERAGEVVDRRGVCYSLKGCKWRKLEDMESPKPASTWVDHGLGSTRHYPSQLWEDSLNDVVVFKNKEKMERLTQKKWRKKKRREESRANAAVEELGRKRRGQED